MVRQYGSFMVRVWDQRDGEIRIEVEHVQTGRQVRLKSILAALVWIASQTGVAVDTGGSTPSAHDRGMAAGT